MHQLLCGVIEMEQYKVLFKDTLTKKFFMQLPEGLYLASNLSESTFKSCFSEKIASLDKREQQWERIVKARVSRRLCRVFKNQQHYKMWLLVKYVIAVAKEDKIC